MSVALSTAVLISAAPTAQAELVRLGLNGARPSELPIISDLLNGQGLSQEGWREFAYDVGKNWLPGLPAVAVDYPAQLGPLWGAGALSGDASIAIGQQNLHAAILAEKIRGNTVAVAGVSMGTLVIDKELAYLAEHSNELDKNDVTFYVFGGEARGFGQMYASGVTVPILGVTFPRVPDTKFTTVVVYAQWDGWANPPDRPWHLLSVVNAVMGVLLTINGSNDHSLAALEDVDKAVLVSDKTNTVGGKTITYMIPGENLPLTRPLRAIGVPGWFVDELDKLLMPFIAAGYSSMTPQWGLHIANGQFVWGSPQSAIPSAASVTDDTAGRAANTALVDERSDIDSDAVIASNPIIPTIVDVETESTFSELDVQPVTDEAPDTDVTHETDAPDTDAEETETRETEVPETDSVAPDSEAEDDEQGIDDDNTAEPVTEDIKAPDTDPDSDSDSADVGEPTSPAPGTDTTTGAATGTDHETAAAA